MINEIVLTTFVDVYAAEVVHDDVIFIDRIVFLIKQVLEIE